MGRGMQLGLKKINIMEKLKEMLEENDEEKRKTKLIDFDFNVELFFRYPHILDELLDTNFDCELMNFSEMQVGLILYCILVNGLDKTKGEKFDQIKKEMQPLIKKLKDLFSKFDKNEIHKERTFIFALRSPAGFHDDYYIINSKDDVLEYSSDGDVRIMYLIKLTNKDEKDERKHYYEIGLDHYLHECKKD